MREFFNQACDKLFSLLNNGEELIVSWHGEKSLFIRFNKSKVRQISDVDQKELTLTLKHEGTQSSLQIPLQGQWSEDETTLEKAITNLRDRLKGLAPLPFYVTTKNHGKSESIYTGNLPECQEYLDIISQTCSDVDLAGILISGFCSSASANSLGQNHWFESTSFCFDYSLYTAKEKAVKSAYSGRVFKRDEFLKSLNDAKESLKLMELDNKVLKPGAYKCYLAPAAVAELLGTFSWGGPSASKLERGSSPLLPLKNGEKSFSQLFSLKEDFSLGLHPKFNDDGEVAPTELDIIRHGKLTNLLTSTTTAQEFKLESNYASENEKLRSPTIETGTLDKENILEELNTGLYLSNLHYLNWSDFNKGRITGMTRFACFYVENGEIVAPIKDLRFDETIYNIWGDNLLSITNFSETSVETDTYSRRNLGGHQCPGMLVKDFNFTL